MRYWNLEQAWSALRRFFPSLSLIEQEISAALYSALARGVAIPPEALALSVRLNVDDVNKVLGRWPGLQRDARGRIITFWGMSVSETPHRLAFGKGTVYAWCAWDALFIPHVAGRSARLQSRCEQTAAPLALDVGPQGAEGGGTPPVVSFMPPGPCDAAAAVARMLSRFVHFFSSEAAAAPWVARHPGTLLMTLETAWELARRRNEARYRGRWESSLAGL
jgi:alkylmercury lyase